MPEEAATPRLARPRLPQMNLRDVGNLGKWTGVGMLIGAAAGLAALLFLWLISFFADHLLGAIVGYHIVTGADGVSHAVLGRLWLLPALAAAGGLVSGLLLQRFAPEAAGIGTDAVIKAFHEGRAVSLPTAALKMLTSALTLGVGATSGVEGPIAQVGAGLGSTISRLLRLSPRERNLALCVGLGAGIAAAFKAPLAGALIAAEVFYREDFEVEAILPALFGAVVGYAVVGYAQGFTPLYVTHFTDFGNPASLILYAVLGIVCAVAARIAFRVFRPVQAFGRKLPLPVATCLGAGLTGVLALLVLPLIGTPLVIGTGHEWLQNQLLDAPTFHGALGPVLILVVAAAAELLGNTFTIGMGNAGGIFGPSLVVGGLLGDAFGLEMHQFFPSVAADPAPFVVVGMISYFAAAVKAPVGTIVLVSEMTGGYALLGPAMVAVVTAFFLSGGKSLFPSQVRSRIQSPAKAHEFEPLVLRHRRARDAMQDQPLTVSPGTSLADARSALAKTDFQTLPVVQDGRLVGIASWRDLDRVPEWDRAQRTVADVMTTDVVAVGPDDDLFHALSAMLERNLDTVPVVAAAEGRFLGVLGRRDISNVIRAARRQVGAPVPPAAAPA